jgi:hypothetical protein
VLDGTPLTPTERGVGWGSRHRSPACRGLSRRIVQPRLIRKRDRRDAALRLRGRRSILVLSGFRITGILLNAKGQPVSFRNFYAKRALRIWPLYYILLFFTFAIIVPLGAHYANLVTGESLLANSNWYFISTICFIGEPPWCL